MDPEYRRLEVTTQVSNKDYIAFLDKSILNYLPHALYFAALILHSYNKMCILT